MKQSGWRKPTPELARAEYYARVGERRTVSKGRALPAVKRIGVHLGLKAADLLLLDMLGAFSPEKDWDGGRRPIVWPSNACLMARTGFSLSALKRRLRKLGDAGVITFVDGPNGKRWGRRDADGHIAEAYGFDLSPLRARVEEFEQLEREVRANDDLCAKLRRQITIARRMVRARIEMALAGHEPGPWERLRTLHGWLASKLPKRSASVDLLRVAASRWSTLQRLAARSTIVVLNTPSNDGSLESSKVNPTGFIYEPHIQTTKELESVYPVEPTQTVIDVGSRNPNHVAKKAEPGDPPAMSIESIATCCPEFTNWANQAGHELRSWSDLHRAASRLAPMIGIQAEAWSNAQRALGSYTALTALALVFEKTCEGHIRSPTSYLASLIARARLGELNLVRSFQARLTSSRT